MSIFSASIIVDEQIVVKDSFTNEHDKQGCLYLRYESNEVETFHSSNAIVEINLEVCNDFYPVIGLNKLSIKDSSNTYDLEIVVNLY